MKEIFLLFFSAAAILIAVILFFRSRRLANFCENLSMQYNNLSRSVEEKRRRTELLMNSIVSPLLTIDREGKISFANGEMKKLAGRADVEGQGYLEFIKSPEFIAAVQTVHGEGLAVEEEVVLEGRRYLTVFSPLGESGDILISCRDVTAERELEHIKRELVTNMSHELKTPLTAIKGYVETLYEDIPEEFKGHLEVIRKHTERLVSIVNDILSLSELEEVRINEFGSVDVRDVINEIARMYAGRIRDKNLTLSIEMDEENKHIFGDRLKIEELFINLMDNAVRYTDEGAITVASHREGGLLTISVKDTGIGIPERSLPRIYERFYVVDKSRSRETGGTGLGLSIAKHIVMLHNGTIDIKSSFGAGTEVLVSLPVYPACPERILRG